MEQGAALVTPSAAARVVGTFRDGPIVGLSFRSPSGAGVTDTDGCFWFVPGEPISFSIGRLELGVVEGRSDLTCADLAPSATGFGSTTRLTDPGVTNRARFVQSFATEPDLRSGVVLDESVMDALDSAAGRIDFDVDELEFQSNPAVLEALERLGRTLPSAPAARNHLRRSIAGIRKLEDVVVPTRDGGHLFADVFHPLGSGAHPVIMRLSVYGKAFRLGSICSTADRLRADQREDEWFERGKPNLPTMLRYSENMVSANASHWVPRGYTLVRVDGRGVGRSTGVLDPFSLQESLDYYDAIEWAAAQPWSNGRVGLFGSSYAATIQWNVAALSPPSLRAIVPFAGDDDAYRDLAYPGGIFNESYRQGWWDGPVRTAQCGQEAVDLIGDMRRHAFDDGDYHGLPGRGPLTAEFERVEVPVLTAVSQTAGLHARSGFEAFRRLRGHRQLLVVDADYFSFMFDDCVPDQEVFLDRFLKGVEPANDPAAVRVIMRTGGGGFEWREAAAWPIPGTEYRNLYLDAGRALLSFDGPRDGAVADYSADADAATGDGGSGTSFLSEPLPEDLDLAGHFGATFWVSSSTHDMDVFVALRVLDPEDREVAYAVRSPSSVAPLTWGCLKVSQRKTDPQRSNEHRPWHTHRSVDREPLTGDADVVPIEIELFAATARISAGHRLRVDITPIEGPGRRLDERGNPTRRAYDQSYHAGARNRVHTGPDHPSTLRLPVVPRVRAESDGDRAG